jgi:hypothetical protein
LLQKDNFLRKPIIPAELVGSQLGMQAIEIKRQPGAGASVNFVLVCAAYAVHIESQ